jgi:hypothetical protein
MIASGINSSGEAEKTEFVRQHSEAVVTERTVSLKVQYRLNVQYRLLDGEKCVGLGLNPRWVVAGLDVVPFPLRQRFMPRFASVLVLSGRRSATDILTPISMGTRRSSWNRHII